MTLTSFQGPQHSSFMSADLHQFHTGADRLGCCNSLRPCCPRRWLFPTRVSDEHHPPAAPALPPPGCVLPVADAVPTAPAANESRRQRPAVRLPVQGPSPWRRGWLSPDTGGRRRMPSAVGRGVAAPPSRSSGVVRVRNSKSAARIMAWCPSDCLVEVFSVGAFHYPSHRIMKPAAALVPGENEAKLNTLIFIDCFQSSVSLSKPKDNESPPAWSRFGKV